MIYDIIVGLPVAHANFVHRPISGEELHTIVQPELQLSGGTI